MHSFEIPADADPEPVPEFEGDGWKTMIENGTADDFIAKIVSKYMPGVIGKLVVFVSRSPKTLSVFMFLA
jgi:hypothetical protein